MAITNYTFTKIKDALDQCKNSDELLKTFNHLSAEFTEAGLYLDEAGVDGLTIYVITARNFNPLCYMESLTTCECCDGKVGGLKPTNRNPFREVKYKIYNADRSQCLGYVSGYDDEHAHENATDGLGFKPDVIVESMGIYADTEEAI